MKQEVELQIVDGEKKYLSDCIKILQDSDLGNAYFSDEQKAKAMLQHALEKKFKVILFMRALGMK